MEHPSVQWDAKYKDTHTDVLIHYITGLENLLMLPGEHDTISEKLASRGAWLAGRNDAERGPLYKLIKYTYNARSETVHRSPQKPNKSKKTDVEFQKIRDLCRRAMASALVISARMTSGDRFDEFLRRLLISREAQNAAESAAKQIGELSLCR